MISTPGKFPYKIDRGALRTIQGLKSGYGTHMVASKGPQRIEPRKIRQEVICCFRIGSLG